MKVKFKTVVFVFLFLGNSGLSDILASLSPAARPHDEIKAVYAPPMVLRVFCRGPDDHSAHSEGFSQRRG